MRYASLNITGSPVHDNFLVDLTDFSPKFLLAGLLLCYRRHGSCTYNFGRGSYNGNIEGMAGAADGHTEDKARTTAVLNLILMLGRPNHHLSVDQRYQFNMFALEDMFRLYVFLIKSSFIPKLLSSLFSPRPLPTCVVYLLLVLGTPQIG